MKSYTLLIYDNDGVKLYLLPDVVASKYKKTLKGSQNKFVNSDKITPAMEKLSFLAMEKPKKSLRKTLPKEYRKLAGRWEKYRVDTTSPLKGKKITAVYFSGFMA